MGTDSNRKTTLKDVAERVGVSAMTVSRALSGKSHLVSEETAKKCRDVAREMGYVPNLMARSLRGEHLDTIVMFAECISSHHYLAELVDIVARAIERQGYSVISCQSLNSFHQVLRHFNLAGAVVIAPPLEFFMDPFGEGRIGPVRQPATVLIHSAVEQDDFNEVSPDVEAFCYVAAMHLLNAGHKHLAYLGGPSVELEPTWFNLREIGLHAALKKKKLPTGNLLHYPCPTGTLEPHDLAEFLKMAPETSGVICINDEIAVAAATAAQESGLRVPQDLSIIGCNDIRLARLFRPRLSTFAIDIPKMADLALSTLLEDIKSRGDQSSDPIKIHLPATFLARESTAPPRA